MVTVTFVHPEPQEASKSRALAFPQKMEFVNEKVSRAVLFFVICTPAPGAWHPAANICTFCPGREYVTMNFSMETRHIANVDKISELLERIEAMDIPAHNLTVPAEAAE